MSRFADLAPAIRVSNEDVVDTLMNDVDAGKNIMAAAMVGAPGRFESGIHPHEVKQKAPRLENQK
jgi:hypothetical protein